MLHVAAFPPACTLPPVNCCPPCPNVLAQATSASRTVLRHRASRPPRMVALRMVAPRRVKIAVVCPRVEVQFGAGGAVPVVPTIPRAELEALLEQDILPEFARIFVRRAERAPLPLPLPILLHAPLMGRWAKLRKV